MSEARVVSTNCEIIRNHAVKLFDIFTSSKETAMGLMMTLYQFKIMDKKTKSALFSSAFAQPQQTANALIIYLEMKLDQSSKYLPIILKSMKEEEALEDLVEKIELELSQMPVTRSEGMDYLFVNLILNQLIMYLLFGTESLPFNNTRLHVFVIYHLCYLSLTLQDPQNRNPHMIINLSITILTTLVMQFLST